MGGEALSTRLAGAAASPPPGGRTIRSTMMILGPSCLWMAKMWMSRSANTMKSTARMVRPASNPDGSTLQVTPAMKRKMAPMSHLFQLSSTYSMTFFTRCVSSSVKKPCRISSSTSVNTQK